tara:strand:+ start:4321 stop:4689 length:369 start_codon:yes stop_codon:yes gene_type:complete
MEDPRELLLNRVRQNTNEVIIDYKDNWNKYILSSIIDGIFYTLADYIRVERKCENGMGKLEIEYHCTDDFINTENPRAYLEQYRDLDDKNLMIFIYDNMHKMKPGTHRRMLLYFMNMLYFDL